MAANNIVIENGEPKTLDDEKFFSVNEGVELGVESGSGYPGQGGCFFGQGKLYITNYRLIFMMERPTAVFHSFSFPFLKIKSCELKKRMFSSKYVQGRITPTLGGGLNGEGTFKFVFKRSEIAEDFHQLMVPHWRNSFEVFGEARRPYELAASQLPLPASIVFASQLNVQPVSDQYPPELPLVDPSRSSDSSRSSDPRQETRPSQRRSASLEDASLSDRRAMRSIHEVPPSNGHHDHLDSSGSSDNQPQHARQYNSHHEPPPQFNYYQGGPIFPPVYQSPIYNAFGTYPPTNLHTQQGFARATPEQQGSAYIDPADQNSLLIPTAACEKEVDPVKSSSITFTHPEHKETSELDDEDAPLLVEPNSEQDFSSFAFPPPENNFSNGVASAEESNSPLDC